MPHSWWTNEIIDHLHYNIGIHFFFHSKLDNYLKQKDFSAFSVLSCVHHFICIKSSFTAVISLFPFVQIEVLFHIPNLLCI